MQDYTVEIIETSKELSKKERVQIKTDSGTKLDDIAPVVIGEIDYFAKLHIHNPKVKDKPDYDHFIIVTKEGERFYTGSPSFMEAFMSIYAEMEGETDWGIEVTKRDSKNYVGKQFLTCNVI